VLCTITSHSTAAALLAGLPEEEEEGLGEGRVATHAGSAEVAGNVLCRDCRAERSRL
jgi:hypothetical protein